MDLTKIPLLSGLTARLQFLSARTSVIAENIANADTPNYGAKDLKEPSFRSMAEAASRTPGLRVTDPKHIAVSPGALSQGFSQIDAPDGEASLTGNRVSLETQAMKLSETRQEYALASSLYRKGLAMLRLAARGQ